MTELNRLINNIKSEYDVILTHKLRFCKGYSLFVESRHYNSVLCILVINKSLYNELEVKNISGVYMVNIKQ